MTSAASARKLALITGASSGIGAAFARTYAARGFDLALVARRLDRLEALAAELTHRHGVEAFAIGADLALTDAERPVMAELARRGRVVDALVNNAGFGIMQDFAAVPWTRQRDFLMTMAVTPCALAHAVIPGMIERGSGVIINVASMVGYAPGVAGNSLYPAVKSLMIKFSQSLDAEYRDKGLKVTALCPGSTVSEFGRVAGFRPRGATTAFGVQTAEAVVEAALRGNDAGRVVVVTGWYNRLAVALMRLLPEPPVRAMINAAITVTDPRSS